MLKRIAVGSAAVLLVCMLAAAALLPAAVEDTVEISESLSSRYEQMTLLQTIPSDGVRTVSRYEGQTMERLILRRSPDSNIYLYGDGYLLPGTEMHYTLDGKTGELSLSYYQSPFYNPWKSFTRENILKGITQLFTAHTSAMELWLPEGIAFDRASSRVYRLEVEDEVETYIGTRAEFLEEPPVDEGLEEAQTQLELEKHQQEQTQRLLDYSRWMSQYYDEYQEGSLTEDRFWNSCTEGISQSAEILTETLDRQESTQRFSSGEMEDYIHRVAEENLLFWDRKNLKASYEQGKIPKEQFYAGDLELDEKAEALEARRTPQDESLQTALEQAEAVLKVETCFGRLYTDSVAEETETVVQSSAVAQ